MGVDEVVAMVNQLLPVPKLVQMKGQVRVEEVFNVVADISRARQEFGWEPRVSLRDGLRETLDWIRRDRE